MDFESGEQGLATGARQAYRKLGTLLKNAEGK
jgi:hypothetical protein